MTLRYALNRLSLLPGTNDMYKDGKADYPNDVIEKVFSKTLLSYATPHAPPPAPLHPCTAHTNRRAHSPPASDGARRWIVYAPIGPGQAEAGD